MDVIPAKAGMTASVIPQIKLVVGLGNPGTKYANTPHNIGYHVIVRLKQDPPRRRDVKLEKSRGFMNESGSSVKDMANRYHCDPKAILIVCDDIDLTDR